MLTVLLKRINNFSRMFRRPCLKNHSENHVIGWVRITSQNNRYYCTKPKLYSLENPLILNYINNLIEKQKKGDLSQNIPGALSSITHLMRKRKELIENIDSLKDLRHGEIKDSELQKLAEEEYLTYEIELSSLDEQILDELVPMAKYDTCDDIILEVQSGAGGQEAMLFASELFQLYEKFSVMKGWKFYIDSVDKSDLGGIKNGVAYISGQGAYYYMQNEIGVHRVQRNPATEKSGRLHTSTIAVIVMPQPTEVDIVLLEKDLLYETMRASGPGGQNVNKTESAVRLKHLPTGVFVEASTSRSQLENREIAFMKLRAKLYAAEQSKQSNDRQLTRQNQMGHRDRSEKVRTYNFQQDRITDHRINVSSHNIKSFMEAGKSFQDLLMKLNQQNRTKQFSEFLDSLNS